MRAISKGIALSLNKLMKGTGNNYNEAYKSLYENVQSAMLETKTAVNMLSEQLADVSKHFNTGNGGNDTIVRLQRDNQMKDKLIQIKDEYIGMLEKQTRVDTRHKDNGSVTY